MVEEMPYLVKRFGTIEKQLEQLEKNLETIKANLQGIIKAEVSQEYLDLLQTKLKMQAVKEQKKKELEEAVKALEAKSSKLDLYRKVTKRVGPIISQDFRGLVSEHWDDTYELNINGRSFRTYSGGQRKIEALKLRFKLAEILNPLNSIWLDEPFSSFDEANKEEVIKLIEGYQGQLIVISHNEELV